MTVSENKAVVIRFNKEFLEQGNVAVLKELVADDFINHTAAANAPNNAEGMVQLVAMLHKAFSNFSIVINEQVGEGDTVATRKTIHATHTGEIMGRPATGKAVTFNIMDFVHLRDGKYVEHWGRNDFMQVIQQL